MCASVIAGPDASAHTPHDQIVDVEMSPAYARDHTAFAIVEDRLMRSTDSGATWTELVRGIGPGASNSTDIARGLWRLAIARSDTNVVYVSARHGDLFRSSDGGSTWAETDLRRAVERSGIKSQLVQNTFLAVSPADPDVVYVAGPTGGLFRTLDGGATWQPVGSFARITSVLFVDATRVVVADSRRVSVSDDGGATWAESMAVPAGENVDAMASGGASASATVFAGTSRGRVLRSDDRASTFTEASAGLAPLRIRGLAVSPDFARDRTLWVSTWEKGAYRSTDGGTTFRPQAKGLTTNHQADDVKVAQFNGVDASATASGGRSLFLAGFDGLFRSDDGGDTWKAVETQGDYIVGLAVSPDYRRDGTVVVTTYVKAAYVSRDRGATWAVSDRGLEHPVDDGNEYAPVRRLHNVAFSPDYARDGTIFAATWDRFIRSTDRGRSWTQIQVAPPPPDGPLRQFVIAVSPRYTSDHTILLGTRQGDIYRSTQRGDEKTWVAISNIGGLVRSLVFSPAFPADPVVFAGTTNGVMKSTDGGVHWARSGPPGIALVQISPSYATDGTVFAGTGRGLYVTRDRGATWTLVDGGPLSAESRVEAVGVSPAFADDGTVLVSVSGTGLFRSTDRGASFAAVGSDLLAKNLQIADFSNPTSQPIQFSASYASDGTIWAYAEENVVRSTDRGLTWKAFTLPSGAAYRARTADRRTTSVTTAAHHTKRMAVWRRPRVRAAAGIGVVALVSGIVLVRRRRRARDAADGDGDGDSGDRPVDSEAVDRV